MTRKLLNFTIYHLPLQKKIKNEVVKFIYNTVTLSEMCT